MRPTSQARIKSMRVPSLLLISVAAAELTLKGRAQTSSQNSPQKSLTLRLIQMGKGKSKAKKNQNQQRFHCLDFDVAPPLPSEQAEERVKNRE